MFFFQKIDTTLTDSHTYSRYDPNHPVKCKDSIQFSQFDKGIMMKTVNKVSKMADIIFCLFWEEVSSSYNRQS